MDRDNVIRNVLHTSRHHQFDYGVGQISLLTPFLERIVGNGRERLAAARLGIVERRPTIDRTKLDTFSMGLQERFGVDRKNGLRPAPVCLGAQ